MSNIAPILFTLTYGNREVSVPDVSELESLHWSGSFPVQYNIVKKLDPNVNLDLGSRVGLLDGTLKEKLPKASAQVKNILIALAKTTLLVVAVAALIFAGFLGLPGAVILGAIGVSLISTAFFWLSSERFVFLELRIYKDPPGPWFCPNIRTKRGEVVASTIILPILGGFVMPMIEACTRKSRWEKTLRVQKLQLAKKIPTLCTFYKQYGPEVVRQLSDKIRHPTGGYHKKEDWEKALRYVHAETAFLRHFDNTVPELTTVPQL